MSEKWRGKGNNLEIANILDVRFLHFLNYSFYLDILGQNLDN